MTTFAKLAGALLLSCLGLAHGAKPVSAAETASVRVEPLKAINLTLGAKRAVGYYQTSGKACNLTLLMADAYSDADQAFAEPVRVNLTVAEGTKAHIAFVAGYAHSFACASGATSMSVQPEEQVSYNAVAK